MTERQIKPAKLAIQSPSGKILRLTRKHDHGAPGGSSSNTGSGFATGYSRSENGSDAPEAKLGSTWETVIKVGERGTWRGLVLADRSARWCVFAEWECI